MFKKILIANRGEIACRVIKTARKMGIKTVAVHSEADKDALFVEMADEAVCIGPAPSKESYLVMDKIIAACKQTGAEAVHPGYGFLSENAEFSRRLEEEGIKFIGPKHYSVAKMGDKIESKKLAIEAGVNTIPGYNDAIAGPDEAVEIAKKIGYPVMIKASAGGGGKGLRVAFNDKEAHEGFASCVNEAKNAFGDDRVFIEKYVLEPRHIEIQVLGDSHGNYVYLNERDCSIQRRHQKVIEEAPSPFVDPAMRKAMGEQAVALARAVNYESAGTVEFVVSGATKEFYFLEMNTRLQVEHPVTEMITGLDLVEWQLRVASGEKLPLAQEQLQIRGHALEARIYAEDPAKGFLPSTGRLVHLAPPAESLHVRVDTGVEEGDEISPHYDPMIAKLIVWDINRDRALARMLQALADYRVVGVANNIEFLSRLTACPAFSGADLDTGLIEREKTYLFPAEEGVPDEVLQIAALAELLREAALADKRAQRTADARSPWHARDGWRMNATARRTLLFRHGETDRTVEVAYLPGAYRLTIDGRSVEARGELNPRGLLRVELDGTRMDATVIAAAGRRHVFAKGRAWQLAAVDPLHHGGEGGGAEGGLLAPMPGKVIALVAAEGARVEKGAPLLILEAMKMEHTITAPSAGTVKAFRFGVGDQVGDGAELVEFEVAA